MKTYLKHHDGFVYRTTDISELSAHSEYIQEAFTYLYPGDFFSKVIEIVVDDDYEFPILAAVSRKDGRIVLVLGNNTYCIQTLDEAKPLFLKHDYLFTSLPFSEIQP